MFRPAIALVLPLLLLAAPSRADEPADLVIVDAKVVTLDPADRVAGAVAVRDGRIVAVGTAAGVAPLVGPKTERIDAGGATLLPGLGDSHVHPARPPRRSEKDHAIPSYRSLDDIKRYIAERAKVQPKGSWIVVRYAFPTRLDESRFPTRAELDAIAPDHPCAPSARAGGDGHHEGPGGLRGSRRRRPTRSRGRSSATHRRAWRRG